MDSAWASGRAGIAGNPGINRRRLLGMVAGIGAAGLVGSTAACSSGSESAAKSPVRIGLLVPSTGPYKNIGADLENGLRLYLKARDNKLAGHDVELVVQDEGDSIATGQAALAELYKRQVLAITGVANPDLGPAIRDEVEKNQIPLIATGGSGPMPSAVYIWRTSYLNTEPGRAVGSYLRHRVMGRVALVGLKSENFTTDVLAGFQEVYDDPSDIVLVNPSEKPTKSSLTDVAQSALSKSPKAVFCSLPSAYMVPFLEALRSVGGNQDVYAPGLVSEGPALDQLGAGATGLYTAMQYSADLSNATNLEFSSLFQVEHQRTPTAYAVAAYDAGAVLDRAIALCGTDAVTPQRVNQQISAVGQVISPRGNWQFNGSRTPQQKWYLRQIRNDGPILSNVLIGDLATLG